jgi:hypothetical protein
MVKGTLHIMRNFTELGETSGVYDVAYTAEDSNAREASSTQPIRRFFGEEELTEFLKKHLHRDQNEVDELVAELQRSGRARILGFSVPDDELRNLKLAA